MRIFSAFPGRMSAASPVETVAPTSQPHGMQDVALVAVRVVQESDVGAAIRVVLDRGNRSGDAFFVATEIDHTILLLVAAAAVPYHDFAVVVAAAGALFRLE